VKKEVVCSGPRRRARGPLCHPRVGATAAGRKKRVDPIPRDDEGQALRRDKNKGITCS